MPNPFLATMSNVQPHGGSANMIQAFQQFMQQNQGKNPNEMIQQMLSSGKLNQQQLNQAQQMAKRMEGSLNGLKSMFGF